MGQYSEAFVAFDVAKKKRAVAIAEGGRTGEVRFVGEVENSPAAIERTIKRLGRKYDRLHVCFEAGPTGYGLCRQVRDLGHDCMVVAPALPRGAAQGCPRYCLEGQVRLCARYRRLSAAAIAREMAAFLWAIGREVAPS